MNYWLFITTPKNAEIIEKKGVLGFAEKFRKSALRVQQGDKCLIYIKGESAINGNYEIASKMYYDASLLFEKPTLLPDTTYPLRFKLRSLSTSKHLISFKQLVPKLSFIKNKSNWGAALQGRPLVNIPEADYQTIAPSSNR